MGFDSFPRLLIFGLTAINYNVVYHLETVANNEGNRPALYFPQKYHGRDLLSFAELSRSVDATVNYLQVHGIRKEMRVLVMVRPGCDLILVVFALFKMGAVPVVIDPGMGLRKFIACVQRTQPSALVGIQLASWVSRIFRGAFRSVRCRSLIGGSAFVREVVQFPTAQTLSCIQSKDTDVAAILFTSGSTGPAKGVIYEHGMFSAQVALIKEHYGIEYGEIDLPLLPVFALFNPALGMATVVPEMNPSRPATLDPSRIVSAIQRYGVTNSFGSPALWRKIGDYCIQKNITLPSVRRILMAGAPVPPSLAGSFAKILTNGTLHTPYGATESLPVCSIDGKSILARSVEQKTGNGTCVGRPIKGMAVKVIRSSSEPIACLTPEQECEVGEIGEIITSGPVVTRSYDQLQIATERAKILAQRTTADGKEEPSLWHRLGDLGYVDSEGLLWFCGRQVETVHTESGVFYTDCCEAIFNEHPKVFRSALIGLGEIGKQIPAIVIEPCEGAFPKNEKMRSEFSDTILKMAASHAHTQEIRQVFFYKKFPVDVRHNAKIHRLTLARHFSGK